jgi:hypothetical protein
MIGREVAGGFLADFDLQGRVPDAEALPQLGLTTTRARTANGRIM